MKQQRGQSLRTRLLVLQIAVTALFAKLLKDEFKAKIQAESARTPTDITQRPTSGTTAVSVSFSPFAVQPLTTDSSVASITRALTLAIRKMSPSAVYGRGLHDQLFVVPAAGPVDY